MAAWSTISFEFNIFDPLKPPLEALLTALEILEAILDALLALLKPFLLDLLNPLNAIVQALIAALNAIINQIESTGLNLLLVHPDTSQPDIGAVFNSIAGGYTAFENKVVQKFFDASDLFRPQYAPGSSVAMMIFYLGAESPGDIMQLIYSILALIKQGVDVTLPAPVDLKVNPTSQSGQIAGQFRSLWGRVPGVDDFVGLTLEWRMPQAPQGTDLGGAINQAVSFYNNIRLPNFIVERTGPFPTEENDIFGRPLDPQGSPVLLEMNTSNLGSKVNTATDKWNFPAVRNKVPVRDVDGSVYRWFPTRYDVAGGNLAEGLLTGSYEFTDDDNLEPGKTYYYRVRAYFGDPSKYNDAIQALDANADFIKKNGNEPKVQFSGLSLGKPSRVVAGFVPRKTSASARLNPYLDYLDVIRVGLLLNFELPRTYPADSGIEETDFRLSQKTGWGCLACLAGSVSPIKVTFKTSKKVQDNVLFNSKARRLVNMALDKILQSPQLGAILEEKWRGGIQAIVSRFYIQESGALFSNDPVLSYGDVDEETDQGGNNKIWGFPYVVGGITPSSVQQIESYLQLEEFYQATVPAFGVTDSFLNVIPGSGTVKISSGTDAGKTLFLGPVPLSSDYGIPYVTQEERQDLANFIQILTGGIGPITTYLSWQALTVGDLFPELTAFLFDFEQFLLALLKAVESIIKAIQEIIDTLLQKIRALKQIIQTILDIIDLLSIEISMSVLFVSGFGDPTTLVSALQESEDKPGDSPYGLHSGVVMTAGGPGPGFIAALDTLAFIFGLTAAGLPSLQVEAGLVEEGELEESPF